MSRYPNSYGTATFGLKAAADFLRGQLMVEFGKIRRARENDLLLECVPLFQKLASPIGPGVFTDRYVSAITSSRASAPLHLLRTATITTQLHRGNRKSWRDASCKCRSTRFAAKLEARFRSQARNRETLQPR